VRAKRVFRVEQNGSASLDAPIVMSFDAHDPVAAHPAMASSPGGDRAVLDAIEKLRGEIKALAVGDAGTQQTDRQQIDADLLEKYRKDMQDALKVKAELEEIQAAIMDTKREIATLHFSGFQGREIDKVTDELDAIVSGTENATETILSAAEVIDENAGNLAAKLDGDDQGMASDIQDQVVKVFEACNFQDLTGQRITKIVTTLRFIEERVSSMINIWGGVDGFDEVEPDGFPGREGDAALLNGPALEEDEGVASQDDIDALFD